MLKKENRVRLNNDFIRTIKNGASFFNQILNIKAFSNDLSKNRFGVIISTKVSKRAVDRNKIKRIIRDFLQININKTFTGKDYVIITKPLIINKEKQEIINCLEQGFNFLNKKK